MKQIYFTLLKAPCGVKGYFHSLLHKTTCKDSFLEILNPTLFASMFAWEQFSSSFVATLLRCQPTADQWNRVKPQQGSMSRHPCAQAKQDPLIKNCFVALQVGKNYRVPLTILDEARHRFYTLRSVYSPQLKNSCIIFCGSGRSFLKPEKISLIICFF